MLVAPRSPIDVLCMVLVLIITCICIVYDSDSKYTKEK